MIYIEIRVKISTTLDFITNGSGFLRKSSEASVVGKIAE